MKTAICLTLLCFVIGAYCTQKKASCNDPQSFYDNSCATLTATADSLDQYCSKCCAGLAEFADECGGVEGAGDAVRQGCEALDRKCGQKKASCDDPLSFYDNSCNGLSVADNLDEYCSKCCAGIAEFADECVSEEAGDAVRQGCEVVDRKCGQKKASCDDPLSFYDNSCTGLSVADNLDEYCSKCCAGIAEFADECGGVEGAGDAVRQGCEALNRECEGAHDDPTTGATTPNDDDPTTGATTAKGSASFNIIASCTVMLLAKAAYVIM